MSFIVWEMRCGGFLRNNHSGRRGGVSCVQQADHEGPAIGPARVVLKVCENPLGIVTTLFGNGQNTNHDGNDTSKGPEDGSSLVRRR